MNEELDEKWIYDFEKTDKLYQDYYLDDIYYTEVHFIYINKNNDIEKITEEHFLLQTPNYISRKEIIELLKRNTIMNNKHYSLLSILKYNITLKPDEIKGFIKTKNLNEYFDEYLKPIKNCDDIIFEKTINMFQDLNDLLIIFYEKSHDNLKNTLNNVTKKRLLYKKTHRKKTIKKTI